MGYTHYWNTMRDITAPEWKKISRDFQKLLDNLPEHSSSAGGYHLSDPLKLTCESYDFITEQEIYFNGCDEKGEDRELGHETVYLTRKRMEWGNGNPVPAGEPSSNFCKTARKPYDLVCCALLLVARYHSQAVKLTSDGDPSDWQPAVDWVNEVLGWDLPPFQEDRLYLKVALG